MESWHREIVELHQFFESYFLGTIGADEVGRLERALAPDFTIIGPGGAESTRAQTLAAVLGGHAHTSSLAISIVDARLLLDQANVVVARYVEHHELDAGTNRRLSTVAFSRSPEAPNGLLWHTVHETWLAESTDA